MNILSEIITKFKKLAKNYNVPQKKDQKEMVEYIQNKQRGYNE